ncbi:DEAD/DEAH box helicase [Bacillus alkalicellulosilyticus]|uniref:DEAD/DEAH box helicase n=1 Tax=Alkalihalobacterium alkalicellulosilyticum TaxID=1912214 RepID=UPI000996A0EB|nr:DEAD/DEAH box helicase [Bacillus alkalicellulosilyticus]
MNYSYNPNKIIVHGGWIEHNLFIWAEQKQHKKYKEFVNFQYPFLFSPFELKLALFRNDPASFYGSFIPTEKAIITVPVIERQFYSLVGEAIVYQAKSEDTEFKFPIEGICIPIDELTTHIDTIISWTSSGDLVIADDLAYSIALLERIRNEIANKNFLPSGNGSWTLTSFDPAEWDAVIPPSMVSLSKSSMYAQRHSSSDHFNLLELVNTLCDSYLRTLLSEDEDSHEAFSNMKNGKSEVLLTHLNALQSQSKTKVTDLDDKFLQEQLGAITASPFRTGIAIDEPKLESEPWMISLFVQDKKNPSIVVTITELQNGQHPWRANPIPQLKQDLQQAKSKIPILSSLSMTNPKIEASKDEIYQFLTEDYDELQSLGFTVAVPQWWKRKQQKIAVQLNMETFERGNTSGFEPLLNWEGIANFNYQVIIDGLEISEQEFMSLVNEKESFVQIQGKWMFWDPKQANRLKKQIEKQKKSSYSSIHALQMQDDDLDIHFDIEWDEKIQELIDNIQQKQTELLPVPSGLIGELRPYQQKGMSWLLQMRKVGFGACLADDMGLGKSIQTIAYILSIYEQPTLGSQEPFLLVCPTSLIGNWEKEIAQFAPDLKVYVHHGTSRLNETEFLQDRSQFHVIITSYAIAFRDIDFLTEFTWNGLILDEAQHIKNIETKQRKAIKRIYATHRIALTGTPIENRLKELWSIIDLLNDGYLGSFQHFTTTFSKEIEGQQSNGERLQQLQQLITPFILRRKKSDESLKLQLPEKNELTYEVGLTLEQASLYQAIVNELFTTIETGTEMERRALILSSLTKLKQICNHPAQLLKEKEPLDNRSEKWDLLMTLVEQITDRDEKLLIFSQFKEMGDLIQQALSQKYNQEIPFLHGGLQRSKREQLIQTFKEDDDTKIFILSLKAGGVGLNLTAATHVIHYDRWWNPAVENQATDRAYRIGQTEDVTVHKFITKGTLEERINRMLQTKQKLAEDVLTVGEKQLSELSIDELKELLMLRQ